MTRGTLDAALAAGLLGQRVWLMVTEASTIGVVDVVVLATQAVLLVVVAAASLAAWWWST